MSVPSNVYNVYIINVYAQSWLSVVIVNRDCLLMVADVQELRHVMDNKSIDRSLAEAEAKV